MPTIVIADDDEDSRDVLRDLLTEEGYTVICAHDGASALAALEEQRRACVVILDVVMPRLTGVEVAARVATREPRHAIIVLSASRMKTTFPDAFRVLSKPCAIADLLRAVRDAASSLTSDAAAPRSVDVTR